MVKRGIFEQYLPEKEGDPLVLDWVFSTYNSSIEITYLKPTEELQFKVEMPNNTYVSLGFGKNMNSVDMIAWHGDEDVYKAVDYWSKKKETPEPDPEDLQDLVTTFEVSEDGDGERVTFVTKRKLDTGDSKLDYLIPLNK